MIQFRGEWRSFGLGGAICEPALRSNFQVHV
jgi:hypothetical protein